MSEPAQIAQLSHSSTEIVEAPSKIGSGRSSHNALKYGIFSDVPPCSLTYKCSEVRWVFRAWIGQMPHLSPVAFSHSLAILGEMRPPLHPRECTQVHFVDRRDTGFKLATHVQLNFLYERQHTRSEPALQGVACAAREPNRAARGESQYLDPTFLYSFVNEIFDCLPISSLSFCCNLFLASTFVGVEDGVSAR